MTYVEDQTGDEMYDEMTRESRKELVDDLEGRGEMFLMHDYSADEMATQWIATFHIEDIDTIIEWLDAGVWNPDIAEQLRDHDVHEMGPDDVRCVSQAILSHYMIDAFIDLEPSEIRDIIDGLCNGSLDIDDFMSVAEQVLS